MISNKTADKVVIELLRVGFFILLMVGVFSMIGNIFFDISPEDYSDRSRDLCSFMGALAAFKVFLFEGK